MYILAFAHIIVILAMAYMLWKREEGDLRKIFWPALTLKLLAGIALGIVYSYYYTVGDTFGYFKDGVRLAGLAKSDPSNYISFLWHTDPWSPVLKELYFQQPRALFFVKITSIFCVIGANNYWVVALYFSFIAFIPAWLLVREIKRFYPAATTAAVLSFLFFPSVVFWTAGLIKESLAMAALCFLTVVFIKLWTRTFVRIIEWLLFLVSLWILWKLKYYYLAVFLPIAFTCLMMRFIIEPRIRFRYAFLKVIVWFILFLLPLYAASKVHPNFAPDYFLEMIVSNYKAFISISGPGDVIHYPNLEANATRMVQYTPKALFSGLYRPFPWEVENVFQLLVSLENLVLIVFSITALSRWREAWRSNNKMLLFPMLFYVASLCVFLALSTPNFGTLSRYRVGFLPFFVLLITCNNPLTDRLQRLLQR